MVDSNRKDLQHPDLKLSRITKDQEEVGYVIDMLENIWIIYLQSIYDWSIRSM